MESVGKDRVLGLLLVMVPYMSGDSNHKGTVRSPEQPIGHIRLIRSDVIETIRNQI
jgi:hypothetical protein